MNKFLISAMAVASVGFGLTSCSSDEPLGGEGDGSGKITFTAKLPTELGSRAFGDGKTANTLTCYVYKSGEKTPLITETATINLSTSVELQLVNGETYDVVFLAMSDKAPNGLYTYTPTSQEFKVDYTLATQNDENRDAFYAVVKGIKVAGGTTQSVDLYRPFAQINFGTDDAAKPAVTAAYGTDLAQLNTSLSLKAEMPNVLNLVSGELTGEATVNFTATGIPAAAQEFPAGNTPMTGYRYLSMNYVLAPATENAVNDFTLTVKKGEQEMNTVKVPNAPMRANYQTNVYGSLLTSATDFTVTIRPAFAEEGNNFKVWTGETKAIEPVDGVYTINEPAELAWIAAQCANNDQFIPESTTIRLNADLDMSNGNWTPINSFKKENYAQFPVFDGNGHTIVGLNAPLFYRFKGTIKNLNVKDASIVNFDQKWGAFVCQYLYGSVQNVTVTNSTLTAAPGSSEMKRYGAIVGYHGSGNATACVVDGCQITAAQCVGGISGTSADQAKTYSNCTVKNSNFSVTSTDGNMTTVGALCGANVDNTLTIGAGNQIINTTPTNEVGFVSTPVADTANYPELFVNESEKEVAAATPVGFQSMVKFIGAKVQGNSAAQYTYRLLSDIDCTGITFSEPWKVTGSNDVDGFVLDGGGHVISNLTLTGGGLFAGALGGTNTAAPTVFKNMVFDNVTSTSASGYHVGTIIAQVSTSVTFENITVKNSKFTGKCNVGGIIGRTGEHQSNVQVVFDNCTVEKCKFTTTGGAFDDPIGANSFMGCALKMGDYTTTVIFRGDNVWKTGNRFQNSWDQQGEGIYATATYNQLTRRFENVTVIKEF